MGCDMAGEEHRQRGKRKRGIRELKDGGERQDNRARGEGCRSGQLRGSRPTSTWGLGFSDLWGGK